MQVLHEIRFADVGEDVLGYQLWEPYSYQLCSNSVLPQNRFMLGREEPFFVRRTGAVVRSWASVVYKDASGTDTHTHTC